MLVLNTITDHDQQGLPQGFGSGENVLRASVSISGHGGYHALMGGGLAHAVQPIPTAWNDHGPIFPCGTNQLAQSLGRLQRKQPIYRPSGLKSFGHRTAALNRIPLQNPLTFMRVYFQRCFDCLSYILAQKGIDCKEVLNGLCYMKTIFAIHLFPIVLNDICHLRLCFVALIKMQGICYTVKQKGEVEYDCLNDKYC